MLDKVEGVANPFGGNVNKIRLIPFPFPVSASQVLAIPFEESD